MVCMLTHPMLTLKFPSPIGVRAPGGLTLGLASNFWVVHVLLQFFVQREISEMRRPIGTKFCTVVITRPNLIMLVQNFEGWLTAKKFRGQNMQYLARFWTTSKFGGEYLRNGRKYSKSVKYLIDRDFSRVRRNKFCELWPSNLGNLDVKSYPPKAFFSDDHISAPSGCCAPKFCRR